MNSKILILFLLFFIKTTAQDILINTYQTESSGVMDKGTFQIEIGAFGQHLRTNIDYLALPTIGLGYGLSDKVELQFGYQLDNYKIEFEGLSGKYNKWNGMALGAKVQLLNKEDGNTQISFLSHFIIPTSDDQLAGESGFVSKVCIAHSISEKWAVVYNVGYDYLAETNILTYSLALGCEISNKLGIYAEPYGFYDEEGLFESNIDFGLSYLASKNVMLDVTYGVGINNSMQFLAARFTWDFPEFLKSKKI